jgi:hypothetical protein
MNDRKDHEPDARPTGGLNEAALAERDRDDPGGETALGGDPLLGAGSGSLAGPLAGLDGGGMAAEAAALGPADGALADESSAREPGAERLSGGPVGGEALGTGAGRGEPGSGTQNDTGDLGGGGAEKGPTGTAKPGGDGR